MASYAPASPTDVCNLALNEFGAQPIGDIDDQNSTAARACAAAFWPVVRQVGRAHGWNCLQKRMALAQLTLPIQVSDPSTSIGWPGNPPATMPPYWTANTAYTGATLVTWGDAIYYCLTAHTSSDNFLNDVTMGLWAQEFSTFLGGQTPGSANGYEWDYAFALPTDYLLISELNGTDCRWGKGVGSLYEIFVLQTTNADQSISNVLALFCDTPWANVKYTALIQDTTLWDSLFIDCVAVLLASKVAPTVRTDDGKLAAGLRERYMKEVLPNAMLKDAGEQKLPRYDPTIESNFLRSRYRSTNG